MRRRFSSLFNMVIYYVSCCKPIFCVFIAHRHCDRNANHIYEPFNSQHFRCVPRLGSKLCLTLVDVLDRHRKSLFANDFGLHMVQECLHSERNPRIGTCARWVACICDSTHARRGNGTTCTNCLTNRTSSVIRCDRLCTPAHSACQAHKCCWCVCSTGFQKNGVYQPVPTFSEEDDNEAVDLDELDAVCCTNQTSATPMFTNWIASGRGDGPR